MSNIFCQFSEHEIEFSSDPSGNKNVPVVKLRVTGDFEDDSVKKHGEFKLDTGADVTFISEEAAGKLGIYPREWNVFTSVNLRGIGGKKISARKRSISFRMVNSDFSFTIPVAVPIQDKGEEPPLSGEKLLLGREGIVGEFFVFLCKNSFCLMKIAES